MTHFSCPMSIQQPMPSTRPLVAKPGSLPLFQPSFRTSLSLSFHFFGFQSLLNCLSLFSQQHNLHTPLPQQKTTLRELACPRPLSPHTRLSHTLSFAVLLFLFFFSFISSSYSSHLFTGHLCTPQLHVSHVFCVTIANLERRSFYYHHLKGIQ